MLSLGYLASHDPKATQVVFRHRFKLIYRILRSPSDGQGLLPALLTRMWKTSLQITRYEGTRQAVREQVALGLARRWLVSCWQLDKTPILGMSAAMTSDGLKTCVDRGLSKVRDQGRLNILHCPESSTILDRAPPISGLKRLARLRTERATDQRQQNEAFPAFLDRTFPASRRGAPLR